MKSRIILFSTFFFLVIISCKRSVNSNDNYEVLKKSKTVDSLTLEYFSEIIHNQKMVKSSDIQMLSIIDSLFSNDVKRQGFYFLVYTKSMRDSDGFYSESLSAKSLEYLTSRTDEFVFNITSIQDINEVDITNWARLIFNEIRINNEGKESEEINRIKNLLLGKIVDDYNGNKIRSLIKKLESTAHNTVYVQWLPK
jgi:hypothetical protein